MENTRFLLYILVLALFFLGLGALKFIIPHSEPQRPLDHIGLALYKPVLYGSDKSSSSQRVETKENDAFVDTSSTEEPIAETNAEVEKTDPIREPKEELKPAKKSSADSKSRLTDIDYFEKMISEYKANVLTERKYRNDVVVRYYKHIPDEDRAQVLVDYGFYLHERPVKDSVRNQTIMSNVIYYGQDFPISDLKLITYLLVNNGLEIKEIRRFKDFDGWKRNAIEIGGDPSLDNDPIISFGEIRNMQ